MYKCLGSQPVWYPLQSHCKWAWKATLEYLLHANFVLPSDALMFVITEHFISRSLLEMSLSNFRKKQPTFWPCSWCDWCILGLFAVLDGKDNVCFHSSQIQSIPIENVSTEGFPWIILGPELISKELMTKNLLLVSFALNINIMFSCLGLKGI